MSNVGDVNYLKVCEDTIGKSYKFMQCFSLKHTSITVPSVIYMLAEQPLQYLFIV